MGARQSKTAAGAPQAASIALLNWSRQFLPEYFTCEPAPFHVELMRDLECGGQRLLARVAPRGHAKSTCVALAYPLWCVCEQRRSNIVILTHEHSLARQFVRDIRHELESNERILDRYGALLDDDATGASPRVAGQRAAKTPTRARRSASLIETNHGIAVQARSVGASLRGTRIGPRRPDLIVCDDIEKDELVRSPAQRRKLERWMCNVVLPTLAPGGRVIVVGSILHHDSLLANLADRSRFPRWDYKAYRALEAVQRTDGEFEIEPLWPARWSVSALREERERIGAAAFEQEYQANPIDEDVRTFRSEWLTPPDEPTPDPEKLTRLIAVDPATGKAAGDFFAVWVGGVDPGSGIIHTIELLLERIDIVRQVQRIVELYDRWTPMSIGIEVNGYQAALPQTLEDQGRRTGRYLPVVPIRAVAHKRARIEAIAPLLARGVFRLPRALSSEAEAQFLHYPSGRHDDAPDVCALAVELARRAVRGCDVEIACRSVRRPHYQDGW